MSEIKVNKISPKTACGTTTLGDSGDSFVIPAGATITNNGTQTGFGREGTVDWDTTPKTATFTAVSGDGFFCNTTAGAFTCNLPAGSAGSIVSLMDYAGTWQTNNLTVSPNGSQKIGGNNDDVLLNTQGQSVTFLYVDDTQGWLNVQDSTSNERANPFVVATGGTITTSGNYKIHKFTGPGTFTVCTASTTPANNIVSYLVVAGGGGAGGNQRHIQGGGGGGAGGFREYKSPTDCYTASPLNGNPSGTAVTVTATSYPITVGAGGTGGQAANSPSISSPGAAGTSGANSVFSTITSAGGGRGAQPNSNPPAPASGSGAGETGGSGGGQGGANSSSGLAGNTPPVTPPQGNNGGTADTTNYTLGGGGGGATAVGGNASAPCTGGGLGGAGATTNIIASPVTYAAGGNSARPHPEGAAANAAVNTGNGGPANNYYPSACSPSKPYYDSFNGGSGIVIIRYKYQ